MRSFLRLLPLLFLIFCSAASAVDPVVEPVDLARGQGKVHLFRGPQPPKAILVFASGDGGWTDWEDKMCTWIADEGWWVAGLNCREYSKKDYDQDILFNDFEVLAKKLEAPEGTPVFYGGWSMGAAQAVAAISGPEGKHPDNLTGLLLFSCESRGRFGLRVKDELGVTPTGDGTFGLSDYNDDVKGLRVAQFYGGSDYLSSAAWIRGLIQNEVTSAALYQVPGYDHGFDGPSDPFHPWVQKGLGWLLGDNSLAPSESSNQLPFGLSPLWPVAALSVLLVVFFIFSPKHALKVLVIAVLLIGVINLSEALMPKPPSVVKWMERWLPLPLSEDSRVLLLMTGVCLLGIARGLQRRKRMAWWLTTVLLVGSAVLHLVRAFDWHHSVAAIVLVIPLIRWRKEFVALSDAPSVRVGVLVAPLVLLLLIVYGTIGIHDLSESNKLPEPIDWAASAKSAFTFSMGMSGGPDISDSKDAQRFVDQLRFLSFTSFTVAILLMLRPVLSRRAAVATEEERKQAKDLADAYGVDPTDPFTLLHDKRYFFDREGQGYVAYVVWRDMAVALGDPVGPPDARGRLVQTFTQFSRRQDWTPLFYGTRADSRSLYEPAGLVTFKVGEDARIPIAEFHTNGGKFQNLRTARNKAKKESLSFRWYDEKSGIDHGLEAQLKLVSDGWLNSKKGGEMSFDLGSFSIADIRERGCAVILQPDGQVECFATWIPYAGGKGRTLDIMRGRSSVSGVMDFLILESIDHFKQDGVTEISLGNAPLANIETDPALLSREERRVKVLFERFDRFYGYKSLFDFKRKYHPDWRGRYLAYPPGTMLARIGLAVAAVHLPGGFRGLLRS